MIHLGLDPHERAAIVRAEVAAHGLSRVVTIGAADVGLGAGMDGTDGVASQFIPWSEATFYRHHHPLLRTLQGERGRVLLVLDGCLRAQNRHELTYNCLRNYRHEAPYALIFERLPIIDAVDDLMILFDLDTDSRWKREPLPAAAPSLLGEARWSVRELSVGFRALDVPTTAAERAAYESARGALLADARAGVVKDPHAIPRNLHLLGGPAKARWASAPLLSGGARRYLARNQRAALRGLGAVDTFDAASPGAPYTLAEFPHRFLDLTDAAEAARQWSFDALVADLNVDRWYFERFAAWAGRVREAYALIARAAGTPVATGPASCSP